MASTKETYLELYNRIGELGKEIAGEQQKYVGVFFAVIGVAAVLLGGIWLLLYHASAAFDGLAAFVLWMTSVAAVIGIWVLATYLRIRPLARERFSHLRDSSADKRAFGIAVTLCPYSMPGARTIRRSLGTCSSVFRCSACGKRLAPEQCGSLVCPRCKSPLYVPAIRTCPECLGTEVKLASKQEQVAPNKTGEFAAAGGLIGGITGAIVGTVLDRIAGVFKAPFREIKVAFQHRVYYCRSCQRKWALTLPPLDEELEWLLAVSALSHHIELMRAQAAKPDIGRPIQKSGEAAHAAGEAPSESAHRAEAGQGRGTTAAPPSHDPRRRQQHDVPKAKCPNCGAWYAFDGVDCARCGFSKDRQSEA